MDNIDYKILRCLKDNARLTASAISEEINLSVSAVIERIRKMESSGVIKGYTIEVEKVENPDYVTVTVNDEFVKKLGNEMVAIMEVRLKHPKYYDEFAQLIQTNDSIVACFYMTGDFDFILKIVTDSAAGLDEVYRFVKGYEGVSATETHFVLKTLKDEVSVIPEVKEK